MLKRMFCLFLALLMFTSVVPMQAKAAEDTYVMEGTLVESMTGSLDWWDDDSIDAPFTLPVDATVTFDFTGSTYGDYILYLHDAAGNQIDYCEGSYNENIVADLAAGSYSVRVVTDDYSDLDYTFCVRYERVCTTSDPVYYISPNPEACIVYKDEPATFKVEALPASATVPKVTWSSSDTSIAKISSSGKITVKKSGVVTITAKVGNQTLTSSLEVVAPKYTKLKDFTLYQYQTKTLKIKVTPEDYPINSIKWKSSDKSIATVSSKGKVTAKKAGTCTITATVNGKELSCEVTVKKPQMNKTKKTVYVDETYQLEVLGGKGDITWKSSDKKIAKVSSKGKVTALKPGTVTITAKKGSKTYKCKITVKWPPEDGVTKTKKIDLPNGAYGETYEFTLKGKSTVTITAKINSGTDSLYIVLDDENFSNKWSEFVYAEDGKVSKKLTLSAGKYRLYYDTNNDVDISIKTKTKPQIYSTASKYVAKGYKLQLKLTGNKNSGTWSSSDKSIATVNSKGKVTGKKKGECTIYCKLKDGTKLSYKIKVVNPVSVKVTNVYDTTIYNECDVKFTNYTNKTIEYIEFNMKQYDYKGRRLYDGPYDWYYCDWTIAPYDDLTLEYWVADLAKEIKPYIMEVKFTDGTYWKP